MKITFLKSHDNSKRLILIAAGWSTEPGFYGHISMPGWDVAVLHDFNDLSGVEEIPDHYTTIYLFAWSLGVCAAEACLPPHRITAAFAVNGTLSPVSDSLGIPVEIFKGTADNLNVRNLTKFRRRMMPDSESFKLLFPDAPEDTDVERLKSELINILAHAADDIFLKETVRLPWIRAYAGRDDKIFPFDNMISAWRQIENVDIVSRESSHYVDLMDIIREIISDTSVVSRHFSRAADTYDAHAIAQEVIAANLADLIVDNLPANVGSIVEIGPGTGFLTRRYAPAIHPAEADFVDITETGPFNVSPADNHIVMDAEIWAERTVKKYDMMVSASAIQWFSDLPRFFTNSARMLNPGALLALSTFLPENLAELDVLRPSPLRYTSEKRLKELLEPDFEIIHIGHYDIKLEFESQRSMLLHLRYTGVAGSSGSRKQGAIHDPITSLTYRPLLILARRK